MAGLSSEGSRNPNLLVGFATSDDAAVYLLPGGTALVQTLDVITPIVDDPFDFGRIAAANSLSDVYAMGGAPLTCMNICCFPKVGVPREALRAILEGAAAMVREAGATIVGGHTVTDPELKFGLSVTGTVDPARVLRNTAAKPGQALVLTKPLGIGVVTNAARKGRAGEAELARAVAVMTTLNREGAEAALRHGATAATDITGFGFTGHAWNLARASGVELRIRIGALPFLPSALELHRAGVAVSQCSSNRDNVAGALAIDGTADEALLDLIHDPQTSGGLLIALPAEAAPRLVEELRAGLYPDAALVGEVAASPAPRLRLLA
jgi:selenide,water dikinase